jgi:NADH-quinone oxidoreductase subunit K
MADGELAILNGYLVVGSILFGLGVIGFVSRRNLITVFLAAELMLQGVSLSLIAWGRYHNDFGGQMLVHLIIAVAASEAAIALAVVLMLYQRQGSLDIAVWQNLREENQPPYVDRELPEEAPAETPAWPKLTPAGVPPEIRREEIDYRPHV